MMMAQGALHYEILLACPEGLRPPAVYADLSGRFDAQLTGDILERIDKEWARRQAENPALYNGSKFRLAYVGRKRAQSREREAADQPAEEPPQIAVQLGLTDYRSFIGTNLHVGWQHLVIEDDTPQPPKTKQTLRSRNSGDAPSVYTTIWEGMGMPGLHLANGLGNAAVVETSDGGIVLLKRSGLVGECPNAVVLPGGHPEPSRIGLESVEAWQQLLKTGERLPKSKQVVEELFRSIVLEVHEETGIPMEKLSDPLLLGFTRRVENHRPCMIFKLATTLGREEVEELYKTSGVKDRFESTRLFTLSINELIEQVQSNDEELGVVGDHVGGIKLYEAHVALRN